MAHLNSTQRIARAEREARSHHQKTTLSEEERRLVAALAQADGLTISESIRQTLLRELQRRGMR